MPYKGPDITIVPPGWLTIEELRDNLVEYMMIQSPYKDLAKEDMPPEMVAEMEKSMTRLAIAIFHNLAGEGGTWDVYLEKEKQQTVNALKRVVNFEGKGITIKWEEREDGQTLIWSLGKDVIDDIVDEVIDIITPPGVTIRWVETGVSYCEVIGGYNTGQLITEMKEQRKVEGEEVFSDTGNTRLDKTLNTGTCPVLGILLAVSVDSSSYSIPREVQYTYSEGSSIAVSNPILAGYNYFFISAPQGKNLTIRNSMNIDVTGNFSVVGVDSRPGYRPNNIYKGNNVFATSRAASFYLTLS